ncbi:hypothetical protein PAHAL_7G236800 [Panicum hallii]|uniref:Uncharacterized protein n=1 Tax=Panicum hallii TaxID=206008 RepID=A0A2T8ID88_9POAL|nr:hypothetical protein PAHAL_7G236800 [Panicum hallii]
MPEVRTATRLPLAGISGGAVLVKGPAKPLARQAHTASSNKENVPPVGVLRTAPKRRSPLPDWYPRTPLRDITSIVKTLERSRLQDAAARQQIQWTADSSVDPITAVQAESTPTTEEAQAVATPATSLADGKLKTSSPSDCSLQATPSKPNDSALADLTEKKLSGSIKQIEKIVTQLLKETPKATQPSKVAAQRRTLMSMR